MSQSAGPADSDALVPDPRMADVYSVLDEMADMVEAARTVPMSDKCMISRNAALDLLDAIRSMLPQSVQEAEELLADRVGIMEDAYREAERMVAEAQAQHEQLVAAGQADHDRLIATGQADYEDLIAQARSEQARLVTEHEVTQAALAEAEAVREQAWSQADAIRAQAQAEVEQLRLEADDYVEGKFAAFEATLTKTLQVVQRGREKINEKYSAPQRQPR